MAELHVQVHSVGELVLLASWHVVLPVGCHIEPMSERRERWRLPFVGDVLVMEASDLAGDQLFAEYEVRFRHSGLDFGIHM
jgi:hypothetical protein